MTKKCLVIGGNGFIGKNLVLELLLNKYEVIVFDIVTQNIKEAVLEKHNIHFVEGDINNTPYLIEQIQDVTSVVWLIHTTVPATSMYDVEFDLLSNVPPLIRFMLYLIKHNPVRSFIYLSSGGAVYGNPVDATKMDERHDKNPISSYGLTKLVAEEYVRFLMKNSHINSFIIRPSNVYGRHQNLKKPQGLIGHIFKSVLLHEPITIFGDGSIVRDYLHVNDLSKAILACIEYNQELESPIELNVASGEPVSINQIVSNITEITGKQVSIISKPERDFDCKYNVLNIEKANNILQWTPQVTIKDGMLDEWNWITSELK